MEDEYDMSNKKQKEGKVKEQPKEKKEEEVSEEEEERSGVLPNRNLKKNLGCGG